MNVLKEYTGGWSSESYLDCFRWYPEDFDTEMAFRREEESNLIRDPQPGFAEFYHAIIWNMMEHA